MNKMCEYCKNNTKYCGLEELVEEKQQDVIVTKCKNYIYKYLTLKELEHVFNLAKDYNTAVVVEFNNGDKIIINNSNLEDRLDYFKNNPINVLNAYIMGV